MTSVIKTVNDKRPVNLDIGSIDLPITAHASIIHRITGVILVAGVALLLLLLDASLASEESFNAIASASDSFFCKLALWGVLSALIYHSVAGVKHLLMDLGVGETLEGGVLGAKLVFLLSAVLIVLVGAFIW